MLLKNLKNSEVVGTVLFLSACPCRMKVDLKQPYVFIQHNGTQVSNIVLKRKQAYLLKSQTCCPMVVKIRKHTEHSTSKLDLEKYLLCNSHNSKLHNALTLVWTWKFAATSIKSKLNDSLRIIISRDQYA